MCNLKAWQSCAKRLSRINKGKGAEGEAEPVELCGMDAAGLPGQRLAIKAGKLVLLADPGRANDRGRVICWCSPDKISCSAFTEAIPSLSS